VTARLRVLALSDVYFPRVNGVSTSIRTFASELTRLGHAMTIVAPAYGNDDGNDPQVVRVPGWRVPFDPEDRLVRASRLRAAAAALAGPFDVVHVQTPFAAHTAGVALARQLGLPVVETYHTFFEQYFGHYVPFLPDALLARLARRITRAQTTAVDHLVVPSRPMAERLQARASRRR
jgi:glycosyltransferase involved in cell wall biosynthesis